MSNANGARRIGREGRWCAERESWIGLHVRLCLRVELTTCIHERHLGTVAVQEGSLPKRESELNRLCRCRLATRTGRKMFVRRRLNWCRNSRVLRLKSKKISEGRCKNWGGGRSKRRRRRRGTETRLERESSVADWIT